MAKGTVLVADDDAAIRTVLNQALTRAGFSVRITSSAPKLVQWIEEGEGDCVVSDVIMPNGDIFEFMPQIKAARHDIPVILISAQNTFMTALKAEEAGAYDYLPKPFDLDHFIKTVERAVFEPKDNASTQTAHVMATEMPMVGRSSVMQEVYRAIARMTNSDLPALISGPSGTGKSLTAKVIHDAGRRKELPFLSCNMTASSPANIAMTLFGDGTGHNSGIMNNAQGGTIFLNEIGNMPPDIQSQLLDRLIAQENWEENQKFRLICATSCDLLQRVEEGKFRNDLYYRLNIIPLRIPALEERREDIPDLTRHFFKASADEGTGAKHIEADALKVLRSHNWPGNVRELENLIKRICVLHSQETVTVDIIKAELNLTSHAGVTRSDPSPNLDQLRNITHQLISEHFEAYAPDLPPTGIYQEFLTEFEYPVLTIALAATNGNQIKAAELLGINRNTLRKKIRAHGIKILKTAH